ncbi:MAG: 50S ribosomal protein L35 [Limnochordia bacterium]|jgi:large subunit ribosomal protein L35|nr:50S ribosomal protein L35 [Limnochordia bacterium]MDD2630357.1 50S ribosomal protein L35 [Limnochordia bacterium]MDD4517881.1 50S ribosomal protein L35 [Limnochordia bacterium]
MPKMKTHRGAAKRFKKTGTGKFKKSSNFRSHLLSSKSPKRKRQLRRPSYVSKQDQERISRLLPY